MSKITFENEWVKNRLEYLQQNCRYPRCEMEPLNREQLINLQPGTPCYTISGSGLNLCMFAYCYKGINVCSDASITFWNHLGQITYKLKNTGKTFNVFKVILD